MKQLSKTGDVRRYLIYAVALLLAMANTSVFGQEKLSDFSEVPQQFDSSFQAAPEQPAALGVTIYTDRLVFEAAYPGLDKEDFEDTNVGGVQGCDGPADSSTSQAGCFDPGDIEPGLSFDSNPVRGPGGAGLVLLGAGFNGNPSKSLLANFFTDGFAIDFTDGDDTVAGFDVQCHFGNSGSTVVDVYGTGGLISSNVVNCTNAGAFFGIDAGEVIVRIEIFDPAGNAEGVDNVCFGAGINGVTFTFLEAGGTVTMTSSGTLDTLQLVPSVLPDGWGGTGIENNNSAGDIDIMGGTSFGPINTQFGFNAGTDASAIMAPGGPFTLSAFTVDTIAGSKSFTTYSGFSGGLRQPGIGIVDSDIVTGEWTPDQNWTYAAGTSFASLGLNPGTYAVSDSVTGETITIQIGPVGPLPNNPPVADAGPDQVVECAGDPNTTVQLDGSGSFDPDPGDSIAAYLWTGGTFNPDDMTVNPTVDVPLGVHNFGLQVFDTFGLDDTDSVQVTVSDTTDPVIVAPVDISIEHTADPQLVSDLELGMPTVTEACGYTVSRSPAGNLFPVGTTTITWTVTANSDGATASDTQDVVITNTAPDADDQSPVVVEDSVNNVITLTASDINNDSPLAFALIVGSGPSHGTLGGAAPNLTYTPDPDYFGPDEFKFTATDEHGATSAEATVSITVTPVNDPPVISISRVTATVQYSDTIGTVTITATDVDDDPLTLSSEYTDNGVLPAIAGLPSDLGTAGGCVAVPNDTTSPGTSCSWDLTGQMLEDAGDYDITFTVTDGGGGEGTIESDSGATEIIVNAEDATINFDLANVVAVQVDGDGSDSSLPFSLTVYIDETEPDLATFIAMYGDLSLAVPHMVLTPVGPGGPEAPVSCDAPTVAGSGYDQVMTFTCHFAGVPVNTYSVDVSVDGGYYTGENDDVLTVFDPSLGFTTGGGWFYWPGTNDKTNFGYVMKYNKKRTNLQGSLLMIRHVEGSTTGEKWRIKSNALEGLAIGSGADFGWASFSGKATYRSPTEDNEGNNEFTVYVEDHGVPGKGVDQFWVQTRDKQDDVRPELSMPEPGAGNTETIEGGNIFVPHSGGGGKGRNK